jgi:hypothetical protein
MTNVTVMSTGLSRGHFEHVAEVTNLLLSHDESCEFSSEVEAVEVYPQQ